MSTFKLTPLDRRHTGYNRFSHFVDPIFNVQYSKNEGLKDFLAWRAWCWQVWGPGLELRLATNGRLGLDCIWAWQTEFDHHRLYFKDEATTSAFLLRWSGVTESDK